MTAGGPDPLVEDQVDELEDDEQPRTGVELDETGLPLACAGGMAGWCGQLGRHDRCYFNHPDGIAAVRAGTYGMWAGHQWVCTCPCHVIHDYPPCPHPDHHGAARPVANVGEPVQLGLF